VEQLFERNLLPKLAPQAQAVCNDFRSGRFYNEEVDLLLKKHQNMLRALYSRYRWAGGRVVAVSMDALHTSPVSMQGPIDGGEHWGERGERGEGGLVDASAAMMWALYNRCSMAI
jgi:hypothetical protein